MGFFHSPGESDIFKGARPGEIHLLPFRRGGYTHTRILELSLPPGEGLALHGRVRKNEV